ncbi:MAG TPA: right-handed parallel beta-helix repeat-containing protein [Candidatus Bathyarchaeia archaeon]|nr:right-handed parallel beta-helix repeat-containing protein [Candidatus Bathyarchaeia archaeon]
MLKDLFFTKAQFAIVLTLSLTAIVAVPVGLVVWGNIYSHYSVGDIVIRSNNDFTLRYNFPGQGTELDPFRIENLTISSSKEYGIYISDTTKYFIINNCSISGVSRGIYIYNIADDTTKIENNTITLDGVTSYTGIEINSTNNVTIVNNKIQGNNNERTSYGLYVRYSDNFLTSKNNISSFNVGIYCNNFANLVITQNNVFYNTIGIQVHSITNILVVYNNIMFNLEYGIYSEGTTGTFHHNNFFNNLLIPKINQHKQASDQGGSSTWYDISTNHGNYWSDLSWTEEAVYVLDGYYNPKSDLYPLKYPV